jgi:AraC-like DNA-binding protein
MEYLTLWRMQVAARLITDQAMKMAAVADAVGYGSEPAFSRAFKRVTGMTPAAWRAHHAGTAPIGQPAATLLPRA